MEALGTYLSLPAHERLALNAKRRHEAQQSHQRAVDRFIAEQSHPVINPRSASVVALMMAGGEEGREGGGGNGSSSKGRAASATRRTGTVAASPPNANAGSNTTKAPIDSFLTRLDASMARRDARREALNKAVEAEAPFTPRTNAHYNKYVKSHFERDAEERASKGERGLEGGDDGDSAEQRVVSPRQQSNSGNSRVITNRALTKAFEESGRAQQKNAGSGGGNRSMSGVAHSGSAFARTHSTAEHEQQTKRAQHKTSERTNSARRPPTREHSANTSSVASGPNSLYARAQAAAARREAKMAVLREELAAERERKEWGSDADKTIGGAAVADASGRPKGVPAAADLTPRRPFSPSITRRTADLARSKGQASSSSSSATVSGRLAAVTDPSTDPEAYVDYVKARERRREAGLEAQRREQQALAEAELTFRPVVHDVPPLIRAMGASLRAAAGGRAPSAAGAGGPRSSSRHSASLGTGREGGAAPSHKKSGVPVVRLPSAQSAPYAAPPTAPSVFVRGWADTVEEYNPRTPAAFAHHNYGHAAVPSFAAPPQGFSVPLGVGACSTRAASVMFGGAPAVPHPTTSFGMLLP